MLLHPFPKVRVLSQSSFLEFLWRLSLILQIRIAAAETLWITTGDEDLKLHDWSQPAKKLKATVESIKQGNQ